MLNFAGVEPEPPLRSLLSKLGKCCSLPLLERAAVWLDSASALEPACSRQESLLSKKASHAMQLVFDEAKRASIEYCRGRSGVLALARQCHEYVSPPAHHDLPGM